MEVVIISELLSSFNAAHGKQRYAINAIDIPEEYKEIWKVQPTQTKPQVEARRQTYHFCISQLGWQE